MDSAGMNEDHKVLHSAMSTIEIGKSIEIQKYYLTETLKLSIVTSPLYCISSSFQFINKQVYSKLKSNMYSNLRIQIFKPSFYVSYKETITNLTRQGILGLYKGHLWRMSFFIASNNFKQKLDFMYLSQLKINKVLKEMMLYSFVDMCLNPLLFIESRYIIQNRKKNYRLYNNLYDIFRLSYKDLYRGSLLNIPRNICFILGLNTYYLIPGGYSNYIAIACAHLFSYPFLTLQRNVYFHNAKASNGTSIIDSTLYKQEFRGISDGLMYFNKEFGVFSLYRGIIPYLTAVSLWHYYVPSAAKAKFYTNIFADEKNQGKNILDMEDDEE